VHLLGVRLLQARISLASLEHASLQGYFSHCAHLLGVVSYGDASLKHASFRRASFRRGISLHLLGAQDVCQNAEEESFWGLFRPFFLTFRVSYRIGLQLTNNRSYPGLVY
jgi:uncharacterized protein YjbI with pentapeptide repeats